VEGIPRGRYRLLSQKEADSFRSEFKSVKTKKAVIKTAQLPASS